MPIINQVVAGSGGSTPNTYIPRKAIYGKYQADPDCGYTSFSVGGVTELDQPYLLARVFFGNTNLGAGYGCSTLKTVDLGNVTSFSTNCCTNMCGSCPALEKVDIHSATTINQTAVFSYAFAGCTSLKSVGDENSDVDLRNLTSVTGGSVFNSAFNGAGITVFDFKLLQTVTASASFQSAFQETPLVTGKFRSLSNLSGNLALSSMCYKCSSLQSLWFYALTPSSFGTRTNQFNLMLYNCSSVTVHFPMAIQSTIGSWSDVTAGFGGTNTTVLFDLVTSLTGADGNTYTRQEKDSTSTATAWLYNDTLYYTSGVSDNDNGVNEPSVSDAIYSDAACTQSVTTITAIA